MDLVLSKIWESIDGCAEHYRCATALYLMSMLSQDIYVIIDCGISAPGYVRELVDGRNAIDKRVLFQVIPIMQLPGEKVITPRWLLTLEPIHLLLVWPDNFKNNSLTWHAKME